VIPDLIALIRTLSDARVDFVILGGVAAKPCMARCVPRSISTWCMRAIERNLKRLVAAQD